MQQRFLLQILLLAQHVSGTTMPIIRSTRVLYSGCCLWYFVLWFSSCWSGVELRVMCPARTTGSNHCIILWSSPYSQFSLKLCTDRPPGTLIESDSTICCTCTVQLYSPEDEHLRLETCRGDYYFMNK